MNERVNEWRSVLSAEGGVNFMNYHCIAGKKQKTALVILAWWFLYSFVTQLALHVFLHSLNSFVFLVTVFNYSLFNRITKLHIWSKVLLRLDAKMPLMSATLDLNSRWQHLQCDLCFLMKLWHVLTDIVGVVTWTTPHFLCCLWFILHH